MKLTYELLSAVNNDDVYTRNLMASPDVESGRIPASAFRGARSTSEAYNCLLSDATAQIAVFAHQDVYLPQGWFDRLDYAIATLPRNTWGVIGVWGVRDNGTKHGLIWCNSVGRVLDVGTELLCRAISLDEMVLIVNREVGLRFDERMPGFHLYGTDIVLEASSRGLACYAMRNPTIHNCRTWLQLGKDYHSVYSFMRHKWKAHLPLRTCVVPVTKTGWALLKREVKTRVAVMRGRRTPRQQIEQPSELSRRMGWEDHH